MVEFFPLLFGMALVAGFFAGFHSLRRGGAATTSQLAGVVIGWSLLAILIAAAAALAAQGGGDWTFVALMIPGSGHPLEIGVSTRWSGVAALSALALSMGILLVADPRQRAAVRVPGAMLWSISAAAAAWFSAGHWQALLAQALAAGGAWAFLLSVGGAAISFAREKATGLMLSAAGIAVLAASGGELGWEQKGAMNPLGLVLLFAGALVQMGVFPALSWAAAAADRAEESPAHALLVSQPLAWAAFYVLLNIHPALVESGAAGWMVTPVLILSGLTAWTSLAARSSAGALVALGGAASGLSASILLVAGPLAGGSAFVAYSILLWVGAIVVGRRTEVVPSAIRVLSMLSWSGFSGFLTGAVFVAALSSLPTAAAGASFVATWVMTVLAGLCLLARSSPKDEGATGSAPWAAALLIVLGAAAWWSGDPAGAFAPDESSAWGPSLSFRAFSDRSSAMGQGAAGAVQMVSWAWSGLLLLVLVLRLPQRILASRVFGLRLAEQGFGVSAAAARVIQGAAAAASWCERLPRLPAVSAISSTPARAASALVSVVSRVEPWLRERTEAFFGACILIPAKALQLMQGGSAQAYLLFSLGFGLALLLHFWGQLGQ